METPLELKIKQDQKIMRVLKISELRYHIGTTNKGSLDYVIKFGENEYNFFLDSTPLNDGTDEGKERNEFMKGIYQLK